MEHYRPSLRFVIAATLLLLLLATSLVTTCVSYKGGSGAVETLTSELLNQVAKSTKEQVQHFLAPGVATNKLAASIPDIGKGGEQDVTDIERSLFNHMRAHSALSAVNLATHSGLSIQISRRDDGVLTSQSYVAGETETAGTSGKAWPVGAPFDDWDQYSGPESFAQDAQQQVWFIGGEWLFATQSTREVFWSFPDGERPLITASYPYTNNAGEIIGVVSSDLPLDALLFFLESISIGETGKAFVLDTQRQLIGLGGGGESINGLEYRSQQPTMKNDMATLPEISVLQYVQDTATPVEYDAEYKAIAIAPSVFKHSVEERSYIGTIQSMTGDAGAAGWLVGVIVLESEFLGSVNESLVNSLLSVGLIIIIALLAATVLARVMTRPLIKLASEADQIKELDFSSRDKESSRFLEIDNALEAFHAMKSGLRSFEKYVPIELVRLLLANRVESRLGGHSQELTIFFSDIAGFTSISEKLSADTLATELGKYLACVSECISEHKGTVDKFIGDAVMAFWGAPIQSDIHALSACKAALECQAKIHELHSLHPDMPRFQTRIGIHTAEVVVGNFGSPNRLNYTAIGDGVNLASRLEALNKYYGTEILISDETYKQVTEHVIVRPIDKVAVKGKAHGAVVYELLCFAEDQDIDERVELSQRYQAGLKCYFDSDWVQAKSHFTSVLDIKPQDKASLVMIERCSVYEHNPPGDWDGVHTMTSK